MLESYADLITRTELQEILHIKSATAYKLINTELYAFKQGNHWLISKESLIDYIEEKMCENHH